MRLLTSFFIIYLYSSVVWGQFSLRNPGEKEVYWLKNTKYSFDESGHLNGHFPLIFPQDSLIKGVMGGYNVFFMVIGDGWSDSYLELGNKKNLVKVYKDKIDFGGYRLDLSNEQAPGIIYGDFRGIRFKGGDVRLKGGAPAYEIIFIPGNFSRRFRQIIHSYLSIKYGLPLPKGFSYYDSKGRKIWDGKKHKKFNSRIFGVGRDDAMGLSQMRSRFYKDALMEVSFIDSSVVMDRDFLIMGDNDAPLEWEKETNGEILRRKWEAEAHVGRPYNFIFIIRLPDSLFIENNVHYELVFLKKNEGLYKQVKARVTSEGLICDAVELEEGEYQIKLKKSPIRQRGEMVRVYPNPVRRGEPVTILWNSLEDKKVNLLITDPNGKTIYSQTHMPSGKLTYKFENRGLYLLIVSGNDWIRSYKILSTR